MPNAKRMVPIAIAIICLIVFIGIISVQEDALSPTSRTTAPAETSLSRSTTTFTSYSTSSSTISTSTAISSTFSTISSSSTTTSSSTTPAIQTSEPAFFWMFGYIGDTFWAAANQSITPSETISVAANLSAEFGPNNVRLVNSIDVEPGHNINPKMVPAIAAYVANLHNYSSVIYGRIDALQFPSVSSMYSEAYLYVKVLGVNGIFFDLAPELYSQVGQATYNRIMQNLSDSFPGLNYLMNEASKSTSYITPLNGTTWGASTYVMPTLPSGTYTYGSATSGLGKIVALNKIYPGRVLLHFDANAQLKGDPMGVFADQSAENEISALKTLVQNGVSPPSCPSSNKSLCDYDFLCPILGAWTYTGSKYGGTLYNSLSFGKYGRSTINNFTAAMATTYLTTTSVSVYAQDNLPSAFYSILPIMTSLLAFLLWKTDSFALRLKYSSFSLRANGTKI